MSFDKLMYRKGLDVRMGRYFDKISLGCRVFDNSKKPGSIYFRRQPMNE